MKNIGELIRQIKEYEEIKKELMTEVDKLKAECIEYMSDEGIDEVVTDEGKITYREVLGKRFDTTAFKKEYLKLYEEYTRQTVSMRFTCN